MKLTRQHRREARLLWQSILVEGQPDAARIRSVIESMPRQIGRDMEPILHCFMQRLEVYIRSGQITVVSADPLSPAQQEQLTGLTEQKDAAKAGIKFVVDPTVLGGLRLEQGYQVTDRTIARQLDVLKDTLLRN